ncbi:transcriptional regulator, partial [Lactobacillus sp. UMNPBX13]
PVAVINDGKASVLAENWLGNLKDLQNCAAITLGSGVGGGIIVNGRLLNGAHFQAGELSFMVLKMAKEMGFDDIAGTMGSAVRMVSQVIKAIGNEDETDGLAAFEAINSGNEQALKILRSYCWDVVGIIVNIQSVVDLTTIAIGGGISAQPILVEEINRAYDQFLDQMPMYKMTLTRPKIVEAKFKNDANLFGALYNLLLHVNGEKL